ncbi:MAG: carboxymuconolactone decarboxylase family protein [SAR202 cluster bacterium]|nr:carboxymuconolactone decarboxylase family protein [SAR202 cluster bacterium]
MARVKYISRDDLPETHKPVFDRIASTRGTAPNVFRALMNSPEATEVVAAVGEYLRFKCPLDPVIREIAILATAREMNNQYEWSQHEPMARKAGVRDEVIEAIRSGKAPMGLPAKDGVFVQGAREIVKNGTLTDRTYQAIEHLLGTRQTVDFVVLVGYYSMLSRCIHTLGVELDEGLTQGLPV